VHMKLLTLCWNDDYRNGTSISPNISQFSDSHLILVFPILTNNQASQNHATLRVDEHQGASGGGLPRWFGPLV
jgi:hypothetical protein